MTDDRRLERRIADFYEAELPSQAPDRVLAEALATIEHTRQRRVLKGVPWRFSYMSSFAKLAATAVAVVAVVALGWALYANNQGVGTQPTATPAITPEPSPSPTPTPSPQPTATPADHALTQTYTSAVHGMSVGYPTDWTFVAASAPWTSGLPGEDAESRDTIRSNDTDNLFIGLSSQPLADRSGDEWIAEIFDHPSQGARCPATETEPVTVDGASGVLAFCQNRPLEALVADGERGYFVVLYGSDDRAWFEDILGTVQLDPAAAVDPSASPSSLTQTFTSALHGMSVEYPVGWAVTPGAGPWTTALPGTDNPPSRDTLSTDEGEDVFIGLASQSLAGRSGDEWIAEISALPDWDDTCNTANYEPVTVDGASGVATLCPERPLNVLVADAERGYFIVFYGSDDRDRFDEILATVQLDPAAAVEPSASPPT